MTADEARAQNICRVCRKPPDQDGGGYMHTYDGEHCHFRCLTVGGFRAAAESLGAPTPCECCGKSGPAPNGEMPKRFGNRWKHAGCVWGKNEPEVYKLVCDGSSGNKADECELAEAMVEWFGAMKDAMRATAKAERKWQELRARVE